jgi:transcriptional regulator GlxA family with amidase domain
MKPTFAFLLFDNFEDMDFVGPWEMIGIWSQHFNGPQMFTVSESKGLVKSCKNLSIQTDYSFADCPSADYLLIPGGQGTWAAINNPKTVSFIVETAKACREILAVCTGAFLLQAADLLENRQATTHWAFSDRLKEFSNITVLDQRFVKDGWVWTSAGISAGIDMALAFIAATAGEEVAGQVQLHAEYYPPQKIYRIDEAKLPKYVEKT